MSFETRFGAISHPLSCCCLDNWLRLIGKLALCLPMVLGVAQPGYAHESYRTLGTCGGYPRLDLQTAPGTCVGLVAQHLGFPRGAAVLGDDIYVVDNGDWVPDKGRLLRLRSGQPPQVLMSGLDRPNAIIVTADKRILMALAGRIASIDPEASDPRATWRDVVMNLPDSGRHPLPAMALAKDGSLYINVGSASDNCDQDIGKPAHGNVCRETLESPPRGSVLLAKLGASEPLDARQLPAFARGLRNSMALALSPDGQVIDAVNARDAINAIDPGYSDEEMPHDTLDYLVAGADYGWPYCFDDNRASPENAQYDCSTKAHPTRLLPSHAAPLGMLIYEDNGLPGQQHHLIISYHGYRDSGHRIVSLALDDHFHPSGEPQDLVWGWNNAPGDHPMGSPVSITEMSDGSLLVTEDRNGTLLKIAAPGP